MIHIKQAIVVEGKYDKVKLSSILDAVILVTNGFQIYKNPEQLELIRYYARTTGVILLTDADRAGFQIRNYLKGAIQEGMVYHVYTPDIYGKERRKEKPSAEGKLGVEGIRKDLLLAAFEKAGVLTEEKALKLPE
ncbi:MAG: toprim domain-containing protein, partial [Ruminococcus sp.]